ncbi:hypothetical protein EBR96_08610 [bacterium]|nr:hypothetical protein [bacterium]
MVTRHNGLALIGAVIGIAILTALLTGTAIVVGLFNRYIEAKTEYTRVLFLEKSGIALAQVIDLPPVEPTPSLSTATLRNSGTPASVSMNGQIRFIQTPSHVIVTAIGPKGGLSAVAISGEITGNRLITINSITPLTEKSQ